MDLASYLAFVGATVLLMLVPGPNVALILANSIGHGPRYGLWTVAGTSAAMIVQLAATAFGMSQLLRIMGQWLEWIRWVGIVYLVYLGVSAFCTRSDSLEVAPQRKSGATIFCRAV